MLEAPKERLRWQLRNSEMGYGLHQIAITSNLRTRAPEAWLGNALLWSTHAIEPGSPYEVAAFFIAPLIKLIQRVEGMSAHERIEFLGQALAPTTRFADAEDAGLFGPSPT